MWKSLQKLKISSDDGERKTQEDAMNKKKENYKIKIRRQRYFSFLT